MIRCRSPRPTNLLLLSSSLRLIDAAARYTQTTHPR